MEWLRLWRVVGRNLWKKNEQIWNLAAKQQHIKSKTRIRRMRHKKPSFGVLAGGTCVAYKRYYGWLQPPNAGGSLSSSSVRVDRLCCPTLVEKSKARTGLLVCTTPGRNTKGEGRGRKTFRSHRLRICGDKTMPERALRRLCTHR